MYQEKILLADILDLPLNEVILGRFHLSNKQKKIFESKLNLLNTGIPLDYLLKSVKFLHLKLRLNRRVLIPRPETEFWVKKFIDLNLDPNLILLDLGSGSGAIGLSLANNFKEVILSDISPAAVKIAKFNASYNDIKNCSYICSNLFRNQDLINRLQNRPWILLANLPYVPIQDKLNSKQNNINFEPSKAIFSGKDGLNLFKKTLAQLKHLDIFKPKYCVFELDPRNVQKAGVYLQELGYSIEFWEDENNLTRVLFGKFDNIW